WWMVMKSRRMIGLLVGALVISVLAAQAADAKTRRHVRSVKGTYSAPALGVAGNGGCVGAGSAQTPGCVEFPTTARDRTISITVQDQSGQSVYTTWGQDLNGDGLTDNGGGFCGTLKPTSVKAGVPVDVFIWEGPGADPPCAGVATQGTVTAKITSIS